MRRTPSTKQYAKGLKSGKILFGRKCNPVMMKQEGTVSFGCRGKDAPKPHSGLNLNKARMVREKIRNHGRHTVSEREAYHQVLNLLVDRDIRMLDEGGQIQDRTKARAFVRSQRANEARALAEQGYRVVEGELVKQ
jgi:hypothetical protein